MAWTNKKMFACVLMRSIGVCVSAWILIGCGMKGPLVLPDQKASTKEAPMNSIKHLPVSNGDVLETEGR